MSHQGDDLDGLETAQVLPPIRVPGQESILLDEEEELFLQRARLLRQAHGALDPEGDGHVSQREAQELVQDGRWDVSVEEEGNIPFLHFLDLVLLQGSRRPDSLGRRGPLVQCVTNYVSMDIMANVLIAANMSPAMAHGGVCNEAQEFAKIASGVNINLGTLDEDWAIGARAAAQVCNDMKKPWVLDPVGFGALSYRTGVIKDLIKMGPTVLKGNASEMITCAKLTYPEDFEDVPGTVAQDGEATEAKGVDSTISSDTVNTQLLDDFAKKFGGIVCMTGKYDYVTDGGEKYWVKHSVPMLQDFTASGCSLGAIITGFCAIGKQVDPAQSHACSTAQAVAYFTLAGEVAAEDPSYSRGPGSFRQGFLDTLRNLTAEQVEERSKIEKVE